MKVNRIKLRRILREALDDVEPAMGDRPYVEQAQVEDILFECLCDWLVRSPTPMRQGGDYFTDFTEAVAKKLGLADTKTLTAALEDIMFR